MFSNTKKNRHNPRSVFVILSLCVLTLFLAVVISTRNKEQPFSCYVVDDQGGKINGFYSDDEDKWYIFLPYGTEISQVDIYYTGTLEYSSHGELGVMNSVVKNAFSRSGDEIVLGTKLNEIHVVIIQSDIASLKIELNGTDLQEIQEDKNKKYGGNSISFICPENEYDMVVNGSVAIKGRGNTSWVYYEKKGYQIEFEEPTSILGMSKAKKWVLLANACDDSMIRNMIAFDLAAEMDMSYTPRFEYVNLWIDGDYRGLYIIGEKVEISETRLNLNDELGIIVELDDAFHAEEENWFYSPLDRHYFALKDSVSKEEEKNAYSLTKFKSSHDAFFIYLFSTPNDEISLYELSQYIDVRSFAKFYIINEFFLNDESCVTSFYWYMDGEDDVLHLGPVWDFDTSMGNNGFTYTDEHFHLKSILFTYLLSIDSFRDYTELIFTQYRSKFEAIPVKIESIEKYISISASMNYVRWNVLGKEHEKGEFAETYEETSCALKNWINGRLSFFTIPEMYAATSIYNYYNDKEDKTLIVRLKDREYQSVQVYLWSEENGQDDLHQYGAKKENGWWLCSIDINTYSSTGTYYIHAYADGEFVSQDTAFIGDSELIYDEELIHLNNKSTDL